ncbi:MAG: hypothetical protein ABSG67_09410 [Thermoguttaceae bacterium]
MHILHNYRWILKLVFLVAAFLLLLTAAITLPHLQAQNQLGPAEQTPAGNKDAVSPKQSEEWGTERDGLRTRLLPAQNEYVLGQPARFRLEMKNFGEHERTYDPQAVDVNNSIQIIDLDGKSVRYVGGSFQTGGSPKSIAPGKTVVLFDGLDLVTQYLIIKSGSYTLQFRGTNVRWHSESEIPPSNKIKIEMRSGTVPASMQVPARLIDIVPEKWGLSLNLRVYKVNDGQIIPPGWESGRGTYVALLTNLVHSGLKRDVICVQIWVAENRLTWTGKGQTEKEVMPGEAAIYLGKGADGYVYWIVPDKAETEWPDIRVKVMTALQITPIIPEPRASN